MFLGINISEASAVSTQDMKYAVNTSRPVPSPSPGPSPKPVSNSGENSVNVGQRIAVVYGPKILEVVTVGIANRATQTPGLLDAPRDLVANIGGYGQIIPTIVNTVKLYGPGLLYGFLAFTQFGAN